MVIFPIFTPLKSFELSTYRPYCSINGHKWTFFKFSPRQNPLNYQNITHTAAEMDINEQVPCYISISISISASVYIYIYIYLYLISISILTYISISYLYHIYLYLYISISISRSISIVIYIYIYIYTYIYIYVYIWRERERDVESNVHRMYEGWDSSG